MLGELPESLDVPIEEFSDEYESSLNTAMAVEV